MSQKRFDLLIFGGGEIARALIENSSGLSICVLSRDCSSLIEKYDIFGVDWVAGRDLPPPNISANKIINCILPANKKTAKAVIKAAKFLADEHTEYVHLSSVAVFASHDNYPKFLRFTGDWYIRVKRFELGYLKLEIPTAIVVYPGIVVGGKTGWQKFLESVNGVNTVITGAKLSIEAPIVTLEELSSVLLGPIKNKVIYNEIFIPEKSDYDKKAWRDVLGCFNYNQDNKYIFFPTKWKEWILIFMTSNLVPDLIWDISISFKGKRRIKTSKPGERIHNVKSITAMTNFYMTCKYR